MKYQVPGRVAIFQTDAILGLSTDQASQRAHQLESLGGGRYRVIGPNVKFRFSEIIDVIDATGAKANAERAASDKAAAVAYEKTAATRISQRLADIKMARAKAARVRAKRMT